MTGKISQNLTHNLSQTHCHLVWNMHSRFQPQRTFFPPQTHQVFETSMLSLHTLFPPSSRSTFPSIWNTDSFHLSPLKSHLYQWQPSWSCSHVLFPPGKPMQWFLYLDQFQHRTLTLSYNNLSSLLIMSFPTASILLVLYLWDLPQVLVKCRCLKKIK